MTEDSCPTAKRAPANGVKKRSALTFTTFKSGIIEVVVGQNQQKYDIHKDLLCSSSPFFRKACNGNREARERRVELPAETPAYFDVYVQWLYSDQLLLKHEDEKNDNPKVDSDLFLGVYLLGNKLLDRKFKEACVDIAFQSFDLDNYPQDWVMSVDHAKTLYSALPSSDPYRRLYVKLWAYWSLPSWFDPEDNADAREAPMEFFRNVAKSITELAIKYTDHDKFAGCKPKRSEFYEESKDTTAKEQNA
ncbi:putative btb poz domain containing protein [Diplodia seriata]|uniref:Putative btb poz domain containing protein n=1 Tax=Diplodia seriata TaxID=420778 RepID=A0A0G2E5J1_9PEZI|nr:putative btb poz domain containing protein [Diplodia seriata]